MTDKPDYPRIILKLVKDLHDEGHSLDSALKTGFRFLNHLLDKRRQPKSVIEHWTEFFNGQYFKPRDLHNVLLKLKDDLSICTTKGLSVNLGLYLHTKPVNNKIKTLMCTPVQSPISLYSGTIKVITLLYSDEAIITYTTRQVWKRLLEFEKFHKDPSTYLSKLKQ